MKITRRQLRRIISEAVLLEANAAHVRLWQELEAKNKKYRRAQKIKLHNLITGDNFTEADMEEAQASLDKALEAISSSSSLVNSALDKYDQFKSDHPYIMGAAEFIAGFTPIGLALDAAGMYQALRSGDPQQIASAGIGFLPGGEYSSFAGNKIIMETSESIIKTGGAQFATVTGLAPEWGSTVVANSLADGVSFGELIKKIDDEEDEAFKKQFFAAIGDIADAAESKAKKDLEILKTAGEGIGAATDAVASAVAGPMAGVFSAAQRDAQKKKTVSENVASSQILKEWLT
tara:strand:+ start:5216 stop:6085 length:870 start_codon:yes stop_codon:yes gene_type:complete